MANKANKLPATAGGQHRSTRPPRKQELLKTRAGQLAFADRVIAAADQAMARADDLNKCHVAPFYITGSLLRALARSMFEKAHLLG